MSNISAFLVGAIIGTIFGAIGAVIMIAALVFGVKEMRENKDNDNL